MKNDPDQDSSEIMRRKPKQERSRDRVEEILKVAKAMIGERGVDAVRMREIAAATGSPIATLYQYFPNKSAIIRKIYEDYNQRMEQDLFLLMDGISSPGDLMLSASRMVDHYYQNFRADSAMMGMLIAVQADRSLQDIDIIASRRVSAAFVALAEPFIPPPRRAAFARLCFLVFHLAQGTVRLALVLDEAEANAIIEDYRMLIAGQLLIFTGTGLVAEPSALDG